MKKFFAVTVLVLCLCGCVSQETVELAYAIEVYTERQCDLITKATSGEVLTPDEAVEMLDNAEALKRNTTVLRKILGTPKTEWQISEKSSQLDKENSDE